MTKLAIDGGRPVRSKNAKWPTWPVSDASDSTLLAKITRSKRWSYDGPYEEEFANAFSKYVDARHGLCCANGTVAIQLALEALGIGAYDEVIVPGLTWQATAAACIDVNAVPVLVDVEPDTWCLAVELAEAAITQRTKAIIAVHLYGCMPDMSALKRVCKKYGIFLIEDCAHQHGTSWKGKGIGSLGDVGCFSFQESKVLSSGEGGFITCRTKRVFERLYSLRNCGRGLGNRMGNTLQSGNYRITEWQAGVLLGGLKRLDDQVTRRDANAMYLNSLLDGITGIAPLYRREEVTRQSYFNFAFRIASKSLGGTTNTAFCHALNAELRIENEGFERPYEPLNDCELYKPQTKKRHALNEEYWKAIDPRRFKLPVCKGIRERTGIVVHHRFLMGTRKDMDDIAEAVDKIGKWSQGCR